MNVWHSGRAVEADGAATAAFPAATPALDATEKPAATRELVGAETPGAGTPAADATTGVESASEIAPPVDGDGAGIPPLLLGGGLAALVVAAVFGTRSLWAGRR
jgi:hypothetical protein